MKQIEDTQRIQSDPRMERPTSAPPQFTPNKARAMQMNTYEEDTEQGKMIYSYNNIGGTPWNKGKNKGKGKGNKGSTKAVDPGAIKPCLYRYVYIWPVPRKRENPYWMYVTYVGRNSIAGWRYNGRYWVYYSTDLRSIDSFYCY